MPRVLHTRALAVAVTIAAVFAPAAIAWNGQTPPNDPDYAPAESNPLAKCINDEQWPWFSFIPKCTPLAKDPEGAAGMSIDRAWKFTTGRPDVRIAYIEGGPNWHLADARRELAGRIYLNTGELPRPERAGGKRCPSYDCNRDGVVNVYDYAHDPRVHRPYLNGTITPQDLIAAFSNHRDDDHNGYVDDISGWNFNHMTNDPTTPDSTYPHSDEQMQKAAAEANNGFGRAGVCPRCTILPVKAGDEALDRSDRLAESIFFAADSGVSAMILETADLGYSRLTQAAIHYAHRKGIVIVQSSNDFDSADHQGSMFWDDVWPGNSVVSDGTGTIPAAEHTDRLATTYRERSNYTSFGPKNLFSASSPDGTTSGTDPMLAGIAALLKSYGRQIHTPLNAGEIKQVLRSTVSRIDDPNLGWPGKPGATFNIQYGYGRPNVYRAMQAVKARRIPPVPEIAKPRWYAFYDPMRTRSVPISAALVARRAHRFSYVVQYGLGPDPKESQFRTIARGSVHGSARQGRIARLDLKRIPATFWRKPFRYTRDLSSTERYDVTIRVQMRDGRGLMGEDRRAIQLYHDPTWQRGFPRDMGIGQEAQPMMADLDGDGKLELVFGDSNGRVHAIRPSNGRELRGWPVHTQAVAHVLAHTRAARAHAVPRAYEPVITPAAIGDLDGDGRLEVVITALGGHVYVFEPNGRLRKGFPRPVGANVLHQPVPTPAHPFTRPPGMGAASAPVLVHLPGSRSKLDVVQGASDSKVYAFDGRGRNVPGWPVTVRIPASARSGQGYEHVNDAKIVSTPTLANVAGDRKPELVVKSQQWDYQTSATGAGGPGVGSRFYDQAIWADGNRHRGGPFVPRWPARMQGTIGYYGTAQDWITEGGDSPSAADINGDGRDELIQPLVLGPPQLIHPDASTEPLGPQPTIGPGTASALAALGQNLAGRPPSATTLGATPTFDAAVTPVGFTTSGAFGRFGGKLQWASAGSDLSSLSGLLQPGKATRITNFMRAYDPATGKMATGFPAPMMGLAFLTAPAVADLSGDSRSDIVNAEDSGNVAAFDANGNAVRGWPKFTGGWTVWTPAVGDVDADGRNEVAVSSREGYLFMWRTPGRARASEAYAWHQDDWHTGRYGTDTRPPVKPRRFRRVRRRKVCWIAPGDDWTVGRAKSYELRAGKRRIKHLPRPALAGTRQCVKVPRGVTKLRLRARDDAGLVSPWATLGT